MSNLEVRTENLSGCRYGEAAEITGSAWNSTTTVHNITSTTAIDAVWLHLWNISTAQVEIALVLNPDDTGTQADVDASTVRIVVPSKADVWALQGDRFRNHATQTGTAYTIAAYYLTGASGDVIFNGHADRMTQAEITLWSSPTRKLLSGSGSDRIVGADLALGRLNGYLPFRKFGYNASVSSGTPEDVWDGGGDWPGVLSSGETWNIVSTSANDTNSLGTGARTVQVYGLDGSYNLADETVNLNGTSNAATSGSYVILHRMIVASTGIGETAAGVITGTPSTTGTSRAQISLTYDQTQMAVYMVPDGYTLVIDRVYIGTIQSGSVFDVNLRLLVSPFGSGGVFNTKLNIGGRTGTLPVDVSTLITAPAKSLVKLRAYTSGTNSEIFGDFEGILVKD